MLLNAERAQAVLRRRGVDALIATSPENVTYASDHDTITQYVQRAFQSAVILPTDGQHPVLVSPVGDYTYAFERPSWIGDVRLYGGHNVTTSADVALDTDGMIQVDRELEDRLSRARELDGFVATLGGALRDLSLASGRLAVDWLGMPDARAQELQHQLSEAEFVDGFAAWREIRMVKTNDEITRIRRAIAANEAGFQAVFDRIRLGATEQQLELAHRRAVVDAGGIPSYWDSGVGPRSYAFRPSDARPFGEGDLLRIDGCCIVDRYWSDLGRTRSLGSPSDRALTYYEALRAGTHEAVCAAGPGVKPSELYRIAMERVRGTIPHYRRGHVGHGIGLEFYETPGLSAHGSADPLLPDIVDPPLEAGMVINVETPYYEIGFGGLQIEDTILITPTGNTYLSSMPRELEVQGFTR